MPEAPENPVPEEGSVVPVTESVMRRCAHCDTHVPEHQICATHRISHGRDYCRNCCGCGLCGHRERTICKSCANCEVCCECPKCIRCGLGMTEPCSACDRCFICCTCVRCNKRGQFPNHPSHLMTVEERCSDCLQCETACTCPRCPTCSTKGAQCTFCKDCRTCCTADNGECGAMGRDSTVIQYKDRKFQFFSPVPGISQRRRNPSPREISVELETNIQERRGKGGKLHRALEKWQDSVVMDGSIGNGHEINTNPSGGDLFLDHIREIADGFEVMGVGANDSCGMHVHVNCKDITFYDLRRVIMLYERVERALFDACHPRRLNYRFSLKCGEFFTNTVQNVDPRGFKQDIYGQLYNGGQRLINPPKQGAAAYREAWYEYFARMKCKECSLHRPVNVNHICRPCYEEGVTKNVARHRQLKAHGENFTRLLANKQHNLRYRALNLHSYFHRGSIEFRHHEGAVEYEVITGFALLCGAIVDSANRMTEAQIHALPKNSCRSMLEILPQNLKDFIIGEWNKNDAIRNANTSTYGLTYKKVWGL